VEVCPDVSLVCFRFKKPGHRKSECSVSLRCTFCSKAGHTESRCFQKNGNGRAADTRAESAFVEYEFGFSCESGQGILSSNQYVLDSGCTSHMINDRGLFVDFVPATGKQCRNANASVSEVVGTGSVRVYLVDSEGCSRSVLLKDCLYLPCHVRNLLSISALETNGVTVSFGKPYRLRCNDGTQFPFTRHGNLYVVEGHVSAEANVSVVQDAATVLWHRRMGHNHYGDVQKL
jgi:hypothetical protein